MPVYVAKMRGRVLAVAALLFSLAVRGAPTDSQEIAAAQALEEMDLTCMKNLHAQTWFNLTQKLRYALPAEAAFNPMHKFEMIQPILSTISEDMDLLPADQDGCGIGRLHLSLLSLLEQDAGDGVLMGQALKNTQLTSPILTLLLDVPWDAYSGMWPLFGMLAQVAMRRVQDRPNSDALDGVLQPDFKSVLMQFNMGIVDSQYDALADLSQSFLDVGAAALEVSPIGFLTAAMTKVLMSSDDAEARARLQETQALLARMISTPEDLDATLCTRWPLWGMTYLASLRAAQS